jgi:hypothetical protein
MPGRTEHMLVQFTDCSAAQVAGSRVGASERASRKHISLRWRQIASIGSVIVCRSIGTEEVGLA